MTNRTAYPYGQCRAPRCLCESPCDDCWADRDEAAREAETAEDWSTPLYQLAADLNRDGWGWAADRCWNDDGWDEAVAAHHQQMAEMDVADQAEVRASWEIALELLVMAQGAFGDAAPRPASA